LGFGGFEGGVAGLATGFGFGFGAGLDVDFAAVSTFGVGAAGGSAVALGGLTAGAGACVTTTRTGRDGGRRRPAARAGRATVRARTMRCVVVTA
jgi:hypothetical protein